MESDNKELKKCSSCGHELEEKEKEKVDMMEGLEYLSKEDIIEIKEATKKVQNLHRKYMEKVDKIAKNLELKHSNKVAVKKNSNYFTHQYHPSRLMESCTMSRFLIKSFSDSHFGLSMQTNEEDKARNEFSPYQLPTIFAENLVLKFGKDTVRKATK